MAQDAAVTVLDGEGVVVKALRCAGAGTPRPVGFAHPDRYELCLVRAGCFQYRSGRAGDLFVDPTTCLFGGPKEEGEVAHPLPGGDLDTILFVSEEVLAAVGGGSLEVPAAARVTPLVGLAHRRLLAAAGSGSDADPLEAEELAVAVFATALAQAEPARVAAGRPGTERARRRLADDARAALVADPTLSSAVGLARLVGCSPHHLSRVFAEHAGMGLAAYRTQLRVNRALERLADGEGSLAALAADCGFADHAHLTRTLRRQLGATPSALRDALALPGGAGRFREGQVEHGCSSRAGFSALP